MQCLCLHLAAPVCNDRPEGVAGGHWQVHLAPSCLPILTPDQPVKEWKNEDESPNLGHLEGWGALLALDLRRAPSSRARCSASSCQAAQPCPPHHHLLPQLILQVVNLSNSLRPSVLSPFGTTPAEKQLCPMLGVVFAQLQSMTISHSLFPLTTCSSCPSQMCHCLRYWTTLE